jgi:hypothetical protein
MSSQSSGCSNSESDDSGSEYSSVEEMYGSGIWVCCGNSAEGLKNLVVSVSGRGHSSFI